MVEITALNSLKNNNNNNNNNNNKIINLIKWFMIYFLLFKL